VSSATPPVENDTGADFVGIAQSIEAAVRDIPPLWPLASSVAVNPFLGQSAKTLAGTAARLARVAGVSITMPRRWYLDRIDSGAIDHADLEWAISIAAAEHRPAGVAALLAAARKPQQPMQPLPTVADLAAQFGIDWPAVIAERLGNWASGYFDVGQAIWAAPRGMGTYIAWRGVSTHDLTPEILGLTGFATHVSQAPETPAGAISRAVHTLNFKKGQGLQTYFHRLLMTLGGWAQYARYQLWRAELAGKSDTTLAELLAIRLIWEEALYRHYGKRIETAWAERVAAYATPSVVTADLAIDVILQEAAEHAAQRSLAATLKAPRIAVKNGERPTLQAVFCIDVRSEVFRRTLETLSPRIQTLGFAGFFGLAAAHRRFASDVTELRLPVLLNPAIETVAGAPEDAALYEPVRIEARLARAWTRFKLAAVSSFAFVEATGPLYIVKLVRDALGMHEAAHPDPQAPRFDPALDSQSAAQAAESVLRGMSLTRGFARLVLFVGHGASVVNNPHASALHCGACGGYSGEVNARLLATLLNDREVRERLRTRGIEIPHDTVFLGGLHDTTTDEATVYAKDFHIDAHAGELAQARSWLATAGEMTRTERASRLPHADGARGIIMRSRDWSEVRPEWGLAGCQAFIAAPRERTRGRNLQGKAFLHDYDWRHDDGFGVLELIMTAPVIVASWISLQYYGSTVAPEIFGGGNKLLHNVTGGIGVVEGYGGVLRGGLPWQSVHDGERYVHEPLRLSVCIEAPHEAITSVLRKHPPVRTLFDNRWLYLFALNEEGQIEARYAGDFCWTLVDRPAIAPAARAM
jgi:uncharacterized protein YbcC (UPF0753/DUF2309 family)